MHRNEKKRPNEVRKKDKDSEEMKVQNRNKVKKDYQVNEAMKSIDRDSSSQEEYKGKSKKQLKKNPIHSKKS